LAGYIPKWFTRPQTVTHPSTNRVRRSATTLIEANALPLSQTANHSCIILVTTALQLLRVVEYVGIVCCRSCLLANLICGVLVYYSGRFIPSVVFHILEL